MDEGEALRTLFAQLPHMDLLEAEIMQQARHWTHTIRSEGPGHGVEAFLSSYGLNTEEGVALMCLAEALLRIPDAATADALIRDTFEDRNWQDYTHDQPSWLVGLSSWGLLLTGKVVDFGRDGPGPVLRRLVGKMGDPIIRQALKKAMRLIGGQFVLGETVEEAVAASDDYIARGYRFSYDILGEGARSDAQAQNYVRSYLAGIERIGREVSPGTPLFEAPGISIKLSALHARYQLIKRDRVMGELLPRLREIALAAKEAGVAIAIDAEEATRLDIEMMVFEALMADPEFAGWNGLGFVAQAYQKRGYYLIDWLAAQAREHQRIIPLRLVKGAYWDSEIKWSQAQGLAGYPVFTRKEYTDVSYLACADKILQARDAFYPQFATHNARTIASITALGRRYGWERGSFEFQRLHGMGEALHDLLVADGIASRIYAPVGAHKDLLAYLIRRLLENGANSSFVHLLMDESKSPEEILADPLVRAKLYAAQHVSPLPLPAGIYGEARRNSQGMDLGNYAALQQIRSGIAAFLGRPMADMPAHSDAEVFQAIEKAHRSYEGWAGLGVAARAAIMEGAAGLFEEHRYELMALLCKEAGKNLPDAIAEVREAVDFCRYYAAEARKDFLPRNLTGPAGESNQLSLHPRGVFACISPWNFPLAIFTGQVVAALVTGNAVVAKPAGQTPRIAARAVALLHEAGVPRDVLQMVVGPGGRIGAQLTQSPHIAGVVFTGSQATAQHIGRSLAARTGPIVPLIAETGGQNAMVVDSSALLEQAVDDIMLSAFGSAGQRCSALRVLFVQEEIADELLELLAGAMQELRLGAGHEAATDIGPVIDEEAQSALLDHIEKMKHSARLIATTPLPDKVGHFVAPHTFELRNISQLTHEVFGPVLHVLRFKSGELAQVADEINSSGYGLTFGIHSRIESHVQLLAARVRAGNIYVNRSMIGATVGVQPFGGEGLSGTGPKAGGPHYLLRFVTERTLTVNTAAIGGNVTLLSGGT